MDNWLDIVLGIVGYRACMLCGSQVGPNGVLCRACWSDLPWAGSGCTRCATPMPVAGICPACQQKPPAFDRSHAALDFTTPARELVHRLKFRGDLAAGRVLGEALATVVARYGQTGADLMVPVPLHPHRLRERGYNQAGEIARVVAWRVGVPIAARCCIRIRDTQAQADLGHAQERRRNLTGAFKVVQDIGGKHVAVVDDVMTTGTTVAELARMLRRAGATRVDVWTCCRAGLRQ